MRFATLATIALAFSPLVGRAGEGVTLQDNLILTPLFSGGEVTAWDTDLNQIGSFRVQGVGSATGCVFNGDGNLAMIIRTDTGVEVIETNLAGEIQRPAIAEDRK